MLLFTFVIRCSNLCTSSEGDTVLPTILQNGYNMYIVLKATRTCSSRFVPGHYSLDFWLREDWIGLIWGVTWDAFYPSHLALLDLFPVYPQPKISSGCWGTSLPLQLICTGYPKRVSKRFYQSWALSYKPSRTVFRYILLWCVELFRCVSTVPEVG